MNLEFITKGNSSPYGKEKIYFSCHPADFKKYFNKITNQIYKTQNCVIYYNSDQSIPWTEKELESDLSQMQLLVVPVTSKYLFKECYARTVEFKYAMEHHIPVLPLMQEKGLEKYFNDLCGDLQFLDETCKDNTALPYEQKLESFLKSVLLGDELSKKVREAFDAYIFLSYRKKDRKYAQELIKLIHKNDFTRDIAIWYDEYLIPGENFNDAIAAAMDKSELFAMVVTPNLINEENYVKNIEYPKAMEAGKKILPAKMEDTDVFKLNNQFNNLPRLIDGYSEKELSDALKEQLNGAFDSTNDNDPKHLFFIGLAYLSGIDVETDYEKAVELLTKSANEGFLPAMEKLVAMYKNGEGVKRDYRTAIKWNEAVVNAYKKKFIFKRNQSNAIAYFYSMLDLGYGYYGLRDIENAKKVYEAMYKFARKVRFVFGFAREISVSCAMLGKIAEATGDLNSAKNYYDNSFKITEKLAEINNSDEARRDLAADYRRLGNVSYELCDLEAAKCYYEKALEVSRALVKENKTPENLRDLSISYERLGELARTGGDLDNAKYYLKKYCGISEELAKDNNTIQARSNLAKSYETLGLAAKMMGDVRKAKYYYEKYSRIAKAIAKETNTIDDISRLAFSYELLGDVAKAMDNMKSARIYYEDSLKLFENIAVEDKTVELRRQLLIIHCKVGVVFRVMGSFKAAKRHHRKAIEISEELVKETNTIAARNHLLLSHTGLGDVFKAMGNYDDAISHYETALKISENVVAETNTLDSYDDLAFCLYRLARVKNDDLALLKRACGIYEQLLKACPKVDKYHYNLKNIRKKIMKQENIKIK